MKRVRKVFLLSAIGVVASLGYVVYLMFWGPDRLQLGEKSLPQLLEGGELLALLSISVILIATGSALRPFLRILFPAEIKNGSTAQARVLKVWDTGVSINDNPQVGMLLEVSPAGGLPFQAEARAVVSRLDVARLQPGVTAEVKYDPQKPQRLQIMTLQIEGAPPADAAARLAALDELRDKGLITAEEHRQKRQEILRAL